MHRCRIAEIIRIRSKPPLRRHHQYGSGLP